MHQAAVRFADLVNERTNGQVKVTIFPKQQLGNDHQMVEMARTGELDIILTPTAKLSTLVPQMQYADLPFLFPTREDAYALLDGKVGDLLLRHLKPYGFKHFTANSPIMKPDDFQRLKIRTMKSNIIMDQFKVMGARPIPIDFHATYKALKDGVVDGQENPLVAIVGMKFYEVQSHLTLSDHAYLGYVLSFSEKAMAKLPGKFQNILVATARELTCWEREETAKREQQLLKIIIDSGTAVHTLTPEQRLEFQKRTKNIAVKYREIIGHDIMSATERYLQDKYNAANDEDILIGLDTDMSMGSARAGLAIKTGMELAIAEINTRGGVLGKQLAIMVMDNFGLPARGVSNIKEFIQIPNIVAVAGGKHGAVVLAEKDLIQQHKLPMLVPWAATTSIIDNTLPENYLFRLSVRDEWAGQFLIKRAVALSPRVGLLLENTAWGRSNQKAMTNALAALNLTPAAVEWFQWGAADMSLQFANLEKANVGVILLVANAPEGIKVIKTMDRRNNTTPIVSHWGMSGGRFWKDVQQELTRIPFTFLQTKFSYIGKKEKHLHYSKHYHARFDIDNDVVHDSSSTCLAHAASVRAYDLVQILALAIRQAGTTDRIAVRAALENIESYSGIIKEYSPPFSPHNHEALDINDYQMAQYNDAGRIVPALNPAQVQ